MKAEAEITAMQLATSQRTPRIVGSHQKPGERRGLGCPPKPPEEINTANALTLEFGPPELWKNTFLLL